MDGDIWLTLGMVARRWSSSRLSCEERLLLRFDGIAGNSFRPRRERISPLELGGGNGAPLDEGGTRDSSRVETGMSGNFLSCSKGVKNPVEVPEVRCD